MANFFGPSIFLRENRSYNPSFDAGRDMAERIAQQKKDEAEWRARMVERNSKSGEEIAKAQEVWDRTDFCVAQDMQTITILANFVSHLQIDQQRKSDVLEKYPALLEELKTNPSVKIFQKYQAYAFNATMIGFGRGSFFIGQYYDWSLLFPFDVFLSSEQKQLLAGKIDGRQYKEDLNEERAKKYSEELEKEFPPPESYRDGCKQLEELVKRIGGGQCPYTTREFGMNAQLIRKIGQILLYVEKNEGDKTLKTRLYSWRDADQRVRLSCKEAIKRYQWKLTIYNLAMAELNRIPNANLQELILENTEDSEL